MLNHIVLAIEWWIVLVIAAGLIGGLIVLYVMFNSIRLNKTIKKSEKKMDKVVGENNTNAQNVLTLAYSSNKYHGKFNQLSGKAKKAAKKFILNWINYMPVYVTMKLNKSEGRYARVYIDLKKNLEDEHKSSKLNWCYRPEKTKNWNYHKLIKFISKYKVARAMLEVMVASYDYEKGLNPNSEVPNSFENNYYVVYTVRASKKAKVKERKTKKNKRD